jgi:hypothetical protein
MADPIKEEDIFAILTKKIDREANFTRMVVVVCCLAILASTFYCLTSMVDVLPVMVYTKILGKLDSLQREWYSLDKLTKEKAKDQPVQGNAK